MPVTFKIYGYDRRTEQTLTLGELKKMLPDDDLMAVYFCIDGDIKEVEPECISIERTGDIISGLIDSDAQKPCMVINIKG